MAILNGLIFFYIPCKYMYTLNLYTATLHVLCFALYMKWQPRENETFKYLFNKYLNFAFVSTTKIPSEQPQRRILFACHPHGVYAVSLLGFFPFQKDLNVQVAVSSILFRLPIVKDFCCLIGVKTTVKRDVLLKQLKETSVAMCPGGLRELLNDDTVKRKGFIHLAKEADADICLVNCLDENDLYTVFRFSSLYTIQDWFLRKFLYPFPVFSWSGRWLFPFWPCHLENGMRLEFGPVITTSDKTVDEIFNLLYSTA